jgi:hypothetical protein
MYFVNISMKQDYPRQQIQGVRSSVRSCYGPATQSTHTNTGGIFLTRVQLVRHATLQLKHQFDIHLKMTAR